MSKPAFSLNSREWTKKQTRQRRNEWEIIAALVFRTLVRFVRLPETGYVPQVTIPHPECGGGDWQRNVNNLWKIEKICRVLETIKYLKETLWEGEREGGYVEAAK